MWLEPLTKPLGAIFEKIFPPRTRGKNFLRKVKIFLAF